MGMIITQISRPTGMFTCATSLRPSAWNGAGNIWPSSTPTTKHNATHRVSPRSNTLIGAPAARLPVTSHCALIERTPSKLARSYRPPDIPYGLLQLHVVERMERQADERGKTALQLAHRLDEGMTFDIVAAFDRSRIGDAPERGHRLCRPYRADLACGVIAYCDDKIERRRIGLGELNTKITAKLAGREMIFLQQFQRERMGPPRRPAAGAGGPGGARARRGEQ